MTAAMPPLRVGTRGSPLALIQTRLVIDALRPHRAAEPAIIRTTGDAVQDRRLADIGGKGLFAKEIHEALLDGRIDLRHAQPEGPGNRAAPGHRPRLHPAARGCPRRADPWPGLPDAGPGQPVRLPALRRCPRHLLRPPPGAGAACPPRPHHRHPPRQRRHPAREARGRRLCRHAACLRRTDPARPRRRRQLRA